MKSALILMLLFLSSWGFAECPQKTEIAAYRKSSKIIQDQKADSLASFGKKFDGLCAVAASYSCKKEVMTKADWTALSKSPIGKCDTREYIVDGDKMHVYFMIEK